MTPTKETRNVCEDCPNILERREKDALFRESVLLKMNAYDLKIEDLGDGIGGLTLGVKELTNLMQKNFNTIYYRIGVISGTIGLITGAISALSAVQFLGK